MNIKDQKIYQGLADKNNNYLEKLSNGEFAHVSVGMLFFRDNNLLLIQKKKAHYQNMFSIVAGHLQNGESPREAVQREVNEELGINIKQFHLLHYFGNIRGDVCRHKIINHLWYVFISDEAINDGDIFLAEDEIIKYEWVSPENILLKPLTFACRAIFEFLDLV